MVASSLFPEIRSFHLKFATSYSFYLITTLLSYFPSFLLYFRAIVTQCLEGGCNDLLPTVPNSRLIIAAYRPHSLSTIPLSFH